MRWRWNLTKGPRLWPSLRAKVGVLVAVFSVVGSMSAGWATYRQMQRMSERSSLRHARGVLDALVVPAASAIAEEDAATLDRLVAAVSHRSHPEVTFLAVLDRRNRVLATSRVGWIEGAMAPALDGVRRQAVQRAEPAHRFFPRRTRAEFLDVAWPVTSEGGPPWGMLVARFSLAEANAHLEEAAWMTLIATLAVAVAAWMVALLLLNRLVLAPTRSLAQMARRLGAGELDVQANIRTQDELGELSSALNATARRLADYTRGLERAVQERTAELEAANRDLKLLATTDGLTGLKNHRAFQEALAFEFQRVQRHPRPLTLCLIDIDHFKSYNDTHGHPAGDRLLQQVGRLLTDHLRAIDIVARYGGEEFAVLMLDTDLDEGTRTAAKLVDLFGRTAFEGEDTQPMGKLTISAGVASHPSQAHTAPDLVEKADRALYAAKRQGRHRVVAYHADTPAKHESTDLDRDVQGDRA
jgi:diguanylate cyclase (GGDEF)-like protein